MSRYLVRAARIIDPASPHHGKKRDVLIEKNKISAIAASLPASKAQEVKGKDLCISPGWLDLKAHFREPGLEYKESLAQGAKAASLGGFTRVVVMPDTAPAIDQTAALAYMQRRAEGLPIHILVTGCLSEQHKGQQLAELYDMHSAGAIAFTDNKQAVSAELMLRALEYSKNFGGLVMSFPFDPSVIPGGQMHEGEVSVRLGLKGMPALSEEVRLSRDIELLRYTEGRLHVSLISTAGSVERIRKAKKEGLRITCAVAAHQLLYTDEALAGFESNYKTLPPLRSEEHRRALIQGLKDGTIDAICSDHEPEDIEHKDREFEYASFGISSIQAAFPMAWTALQSKLDIETVVQKLTHGAYGVLGLQPIRIQEGSEAEVTVFSAAENSIFIKENWASASTYSPAFGATLQGKVYSLLR